MRQRWPAPSPASTASAQWWSMTRSPTPIPAVSGTDLVWLRRQVNGGPGAARQTGVAAVRTPLVAFVDAGVEPPPGWLDALVAHFDDPAVVAVAPRVVSAPGDGSMRDRYEQMHSPLDLGAAEARVAPRTQVAYVPTAALVARLDAIEAVGGFDPDLRFGEDVDLIWRLVAAGGTVRYVPAVRVRHRPRNHLVGVGEPASGLRVCGGAAGAPPPGSGAAGGGVGLERCGVVPRRGRPSGGGGGGCVGVRSVVAPQARLGRPRPLGRDVAAGGSWPSPRRPLAGQGGDPDVVAVGVRRCVVQQAGPVGAGCGDAGAAARLEAASRYRQGALRGGPAGRRRGLRRRGLGRLPTRAFSCGAQTRPDLLARPPTRVES